MVERYDNHLIYDVFELTHRLVDQSKIDHLILYENNLKRMVQLKLNINLKVKIVNIIFYVLIITKKRT